jgi:GNAT superfamily N-acetyltransferase
VPVGVSIRRARTEDALAVAGVHIRSWRAAYGGLIEAEFLAGLREEERAASYRFDGGEPGAPETLVALEGETIVGFATVGPSRDEDAPEAGEIRALYIDPPHWGAGVGRLLLREARRQLRERGFETAILWVLLGNEGAERFYRSDGWVRDGAEREEQPYGVVSNVRRFRRGL